MPYNVTMTYNAPYRGRYATFEARDTGARTVKGEVREEYKNGDTVWVLGSVDELVKGWGQIGGPKKGEPLSVRLRLSKPISIDGKRVEFIKALIAPVDARYRGPVLRQELRITGELSHGTLLSANARAKQR